MPDRRHHIPADLRSQSQTYQIIKSVTWLRQKPSRQGAIDSQLLFGEVFEVFDQHNNWVFGQVGPYVSGSKFKGYVGWVKRTDVSPLAPPKDKGPFYRVRVLRAPLFARANIKRPFVRQGLEGGLCLNAKIRVEDKVRGHDGTEFYKLEALNAYIHTKHIISDNVMKDPDFSRPDFAHSDFVSVAEQHMGQPYVWGGVSSSGLDCSGLVRSALRATGRDGPRDADQQETALGKALPAAQCDSLSDLKRGDLVFWPGHVGIMQSATHMVHANAFHMCVESEPLKIAVSRIEKNSGAVRQIKRL